MWLDTVKLAYEYRHIIYKSLAESRSHSQTPEGISILSHIARVMHFPAYDVINILF